MAAAREIELAAPRVACTGGVWQSPWVSDAFDAALVGATRVAPRLPPVAGAVLRAMGRTVGDEVVDSLAAGLLDARVHLG